MRIATRVKWNSLVYVATRKPVLIAWGVGAVFSTLLLIVPGGHSSLGTLGTVASIIGLSVVCGFGIAVLALGPAFMLLRASTKPTLELQPDEIVLHERYGNHVLGRESRAGKLLVTNRRLGFQPSRFSVQLAAWSVGLDQIDSVDVVDERHDHGTPRGLLSIGTKCETALLGAMRPQELAEYLGKLRIRNEHERGPIETTIPEATIVRR